MSPTKEYMKNLLQKITHIAKKVSWRKAGAWGITLVVSFMMVLSSVLLVPRFFGMRVYAVATGSMEPTYAVGGLVFTQPISTHEIKIGDCITYRFGNETITHRVIRLEEKNNIFITQGDKNKFEDPPVAYSDLIGKTTDFYLPLLGYFVIWAHQMNLLVVAFLGISLLLVWLGRRLYFVLKERRKRHEAQC